MAFRLMPPFDGSFYGSLAGFFSTEIASSAAGIAWS